jgi:hypothetical protein
MRIQNSTHWRSEDIETLVRRIAKDEWDFTLVRTRVRVKYLRKNGHALGWCFYGRVHIILNLPRTGPVDVVQLAHTIAHEFGHARGLKHAEMHMPPGRYDYATGWRDYYAWATAFQIREKEAKLKPTSVARVETKVAETEKRIAHWQSKVKRATTFLRKYNRRLRYLESRQAALRHKEGTNPN